MKWEGYRMEEKLERERSMFRLFAAAMMIATITFGLLELTGVIHI
jgi:hypothetical protein